jgi:hypothetical protein
MTTQTKGLIALALLSLSFAAGRYSVNETTEHTAIKIDESRSTNTDKDIKRVEVIVKEPNGRETRTITEEDKSKVSERVDSSTNIETVIETGKRSTINVSALVGMNWENRHPAIYGISVNKEILGPITIGAWGLNNGTVGLSIGVNF